MGAFHYDGFLMKMLVKVGNMMIVSFFWLLSCIPIITIIPATAALFHTTTKVIRQNGTGVTRVFFTHLRSSLKQGIALSVICLLCGLLLYTALDFGRQVWKNGTLWALYYAFGFLLTYVYLTMMLFIPPTLSRFECSVTGTLRLALYLASRNLLRSIWILILFVFMALLVYIYPVTLLIIPGLYFDLICGGIEKTLLAFIKDNRLTGDEQTSIAQASDEQVSKTNMEMASLDASRLEMSSLEQAHLMDEPDEPSGRMGDIDE